MASVRSPRKFPQHKDWVIDIIRCLEEEFESNVDETSVAVSIFNVPKTLLLSKPEAYVPHMVAIGPYHHGRLELFEMERYKLISVKRTQRKFYLPVVDLDDNSDVVLRNVVAYEASVAPETMIFTRYVELMNGLVDTAEDVKRLREAGIILNRLKSDEEVANLWNGITLSVKMTKVPVIDKAIDSVKKYYSGL